jgi:hypothetical protein
LPKRNRILVALLSLALVATVACSQDSSPSIDGPTLSSAEIIAIVEGRLMQISFGVNTTNSCLFVLQNTEDWPDLASADYEGDGIWKVNLGNPVRWSWRVFEVSHSTTTLKHKIPRC